MVLCSYVQKVKLFQKGDYAKLEKLQSMQQNAGYLGRHILAEFFGCNPNVLNNVELIQEKMTQAAVECGATVVQTCFHMFNPYGVSGVVIISESHLAIHTWPELGYAAVDLFTCGENCDPKIAYDFLNPFFEDHFDKYIWCFAADTLLMRSPPCLN